MRENELQDQIRKAIAAPNVRIFRNQTGVFKSFDGKRTVKVGTVGASDLIGFISRTITPEMVNTKIAQYVALEVKTQTGVASKEQKAFIEMVKNHGGISCICRSVDDAKEALK